MKVDCFTVVNFLTNCGYALISVYMEISALAPRSYMHLRARFESIQMILLPVQEHRYISPRKNTLPLFAESFPREKAFSWKSV